MCGVQDYMSLVKILSVQDEVSMYQQPGVKWRRESLLIKIDY
jgi:hypothetical protein